MERCSACGSPDLQTSEPAERRHDIADLPKVVLHDVPALRCERCGHLDVKVPATEDLHPAVARAVIAKRQRLTPAEVRFLRQQLGLSGVELAMHLGATPESVSRWENGRTPMGVTADRLLRLMVVVAQGRPYALNTLRIVARRGSAATSVHVRWSNGSWEPLVL